MNYTSIGPEREFRSFHLGPRGEARVYLQVSGSRTGLKISGLPRITSLNCDTEQLLLCTF